jgi:pyruvoyl-dependent arginine decarboxylase (PvlArgDC)
VSSGGAALGVGWGSGAWGWVSEEEEFGNHSAGHTV